MDFDMKEVLQLGVPTGLLVLLMRQGLPFVRDWLQQFLTTIREGFERMEDLVKQRDERWLELLTQIHRDHREDRAEDQKLRQELGDHFQAALQGKPH